MNVITTDIILTVAFLSKNNAILNFKDQILVLDGEEYDLTEKNDMTDKY